MLTASPTSFGTKSLHVFTCAELPLNWTPQLIQVMAAIIHVITSIYVRVVQTGLCNKDGKFIHPKDMFFFAGTNFHFKIRFLPLKWANLGVE